MNAPSLLLFDLGGVLLENQTFDKLNALLPEPLANTALKDRWLASAAVRNFELGKISPGDFAQTFVAEWNIPLSSAEFLKQFRDWLIGFYPEARATIQTLRKHYRVGCLSNSNVVHWEKFEKFENIFDIALSSHLLGVIKPDEAAFMRTFTECGTAPSAIYFFDDSLANIHSAQRLGMQAFHVEGMEQLLQALQDLRLL